MKQLQYLIAFLFILLSATLSTAQKTSNIEGHWDMKVESALGSGSPTFDLKQAPDASITGTYKGRLGEAAVKGTVKGNIINMEFTISGNVIAYDGTVDGDAMKGKIKFSDQGEGTFAGTRKK